MAIFYGIFMHSFTFVIVQGSRHWHTPGSPAMATRIYLCLLFYLYYCSGAQTLPYSRKSKHDNTEYLYSCYCLGAQTLPYPRKSAIATRNIYAYSFTYVIVQGARHCHTPGSPAMATRNIHAFFYLCYFLGAQTLSYPRKSCHGITEYLWFLWHVIVQGPRHCHTLGSSTMAKRNICAFFYLCYCLGAQTLPYPWKSFRGNPLLKIGRLTVRMKT